MRVQMRDQGSLYIAPLRVSDCEVLTGGIPPSHWTIVSSRTEVIMHLVVQVCVNVVNISVECTAVAVFMSSQCTPILQRFLDPPGVAATGLLICLIVCAADAGETD